MESAPIPAANILAPFDGSPAAETALAYAARLCPRNGTLHILEVLPEPKPILGVLGETILGAEEVDRLTREGAARELAAAADHIHRNAPGIRSQPVLETGDPAETIVRVARQHEIGLIVMATSGRGARPGSEGFGSVAHRVSRTSPVPVLMVTPTEGEPPAIRRLVLPLDGSELSQRTVPVAAALAKHLDVPVHLVSVVDLSETLVPPLDYAAAIGSQRLGELLADTRRDCDRLVEGQGARLLRNGVTASWEVREGPVAATLLDVLDAGDLLVISSHGRSSVRRWHLGSVAEKLIRSGHANVLMLRPPAEMIAAAEAPQVGSARGER